MIEKVLFPELRIIKNFDIHSSTNIHGESSDRKDYKDSMRASRHSLGKEQNFAIFLFTQTCCCMTL